jgi:nicotinate-nucleotide pyrophosphorylase
VANFPPDRCTGTTEIFQSALRSIRAAACARRSDPRGRRLETGSIFVGGGCLPRFRIREHYGVNSGPVALIGVFKISGRVALISVVLVHS